jgi:DNA-binding winged helix-turn-helix (wHTH) protein
MMTKVEIENVVATLGLLLELRNQCAYRGRGWWLLNNACCHVDDDFWSQTQREVKRSVVHGLQCSAAAKQHRNSCYSLIAPEMETLSSSAKESSVRNSTTTLSKTSYEFGRFRLGVEEHVLFRDDQLVALTPKGFEILLALVEKGGEVVSKDDLMKQVWPNVFVEEGNLTQHISLLRKILGERPDGEQFIKTAPKRGYCFVAEIKRVDH